MSEGHGLGTKGQLKSPYFATGKCLTFLYYLATNKGSLSVYLSTQHSYPQLLWSVQGGEKTTNKWEKATIPLKQPISKQLQAQVSLLLRFVNAVFIQEITLYKHFGRARPSHTLLQHPIAAPYCSILFQHSIPALYNSTLYQHSIPALYTNTLYQHSIPALYTNTLYQHSIPALYTKGGGMG